MPRESTVQPIASSLPMHSREKDAAIRKSNQLSEQELTYVRAQHTHMSTTMIDYTRMARDRKKIAEQT